MNERAAEGITFDETMAGGFSLDTSDPEFGEVQGRKAGNILAMHATVTIDDIERFVADPRHEGRLEGSVEYPPFGEPIRADDGVFNLFSPSDDPRTKHMVYELGLRWQGKAYYLAGRKEVRDDPGFDLWKDTTTLYTSLHEGSDKGGEVVGAGILTLGVADLMRLVGSMRATGADNAGDKTRTVAAFGRFFMGELWDTYAKKLAG